MAAIRFNAITYSNKLTKAGLLKNIADVHAEELSEIINQDLVTKCDLEAVRQNIVHEIETSTQIVGRRIDSVTQNLGHELDLLKNTVIANQVALESRLRDLENRMTIKLGGMMVVGLSILGFLLKQ